MDKLILRILKLGNRLAKSNRVVDICATFATARSVLVFMPHQLVDFGFARKFVPQLISSFPHAKVNFVLRKNFESLMDHKDNYGTIFVADNDVNYFGLPKKNLRQRVLATQHDIVIDLNDDFHLLSTYLCQKSKATLKICLDHVNREPFYNFSFRSQLQRELEEKYRRLVQYLKAFVVARATDSVSA